MIAFLLSLSFSLSHSPPHLIHSLVAGVHSPRGDDNRFQWSMVSKQLVNGREKRREREKRVLQLNTK
jgi:hypothetical protein